MKHILDRHERIALLFSGGKDSLACLLLLRPYWDRLTVIWVNTGAAFPETIEIMERVRATVKNFVEVTSNVLEDVARNGFPVDILPFTRTVLGRILDGHTKPLMRLSAACCATNRWFPLFTATKALGATLVITGRRASDHRKPPEKSGDVVNGVEYFCPIETWSADAVRSFLGERLPAHYRYTESSLECWNCTAYLYEDAGRMTYMRRFHPDKLVYVEKRLSDLRDAVNEELTHVNTYLDAANADSPATIVGGTQAPHVLRLDGSPAEGVEGEAQDLMSDAIAPTEPRRDQGGVASVEASPPGDGTEANRGAVPFEQIALS